MTAEEVIDFVYGTLIERAAFPSLDQIAEQFNTDRTTIARLIRGAKLGKTLLLDDHDAIWMAGPFSARATSYRVRSSDRIWWANCAWDALGVGALIDAPVDISANCTDCGEQLDFRVAPGDGRVPPWIVHFLVPARRWYDDIRFT